MNENVGKLISVVFFSNGDSLCPPSGEQWRLDWEEIRGSGGYQDVYSITRWNGDSKEIGRWNLLLLAGWEYTMQSRLEPK